MAVNTTPAFVGVLKDWYTVSGIVTVANTTRDLTSGTIYTFMTAGTNGSRIDHIEIQPLGTNVATVIRFWINNGSTTATRENTQLFCEVSMPSTTATDAAALTPTILKAGAGSPSGTPPLPDNGLILTAGYKIYVTTGTTVAAGFHINAFGGDY